MHAFCHLLFIVTSLRVTVKVRQEDVPYLENRAGPKFRSAALASYHSCFVSPVVRAHRFFFFFFFLLFPFFLFSLFAHAGLKGGTCAIAGDAEDGVVSLACQYLYDRISSGANNASHDLKCVVMFDLAGWTHV